MKNKDPEKVKVSYRSMKFFLVKLSNKKFFFKNIYGFSIYENFILSAFLCYRIFFKPFKKKPEFKRIEKERIEVFDGKLLKILDEIIAKTIPKSIFKDIQKFMPNMNDINKNNFFFEFDAVGPRFFGDGVIKDAFRPSRNFICAAQHGAGGSTSYSFLSTLGQFLSEKYICWGKEFPRTSAKNCEFLYAPSALLSKLRDKHEYKNDELVFVGTNINPLWDGILYPSPLNLGHYLVAKKYFFVNLRNDIFKKSYYKLYISPNYEDFDERKFISELFPDLKILGCTYNLDEKIKKSKLIVMDHLDGTTFYKAMAANTPIICYNGYPFFEFYPNAKRIYDKFRSVGVVFDDPRLAADFINKEWGNIKNWWSSERLQDLRQEFCNLYAQNSKFYLFKWAQMILTM